MLKSAVAPLVLIFRIEHVSVCHWLKNILEPVVIWINSGITPWVGYEIIVTVHFLMVCIKNILVEKGLRNSLLMWQLLTRQDLRVEGHLNPISVGAVLGTGQYLWEYRTGKFATGPPITFVLLLNRATSYFECWLNRATSYFDVGFERSRRLFWLNNIRGHGFLLVFIPKS